MNSSKTIIFDFDSTFIKCETLDTLAKIIYQDSPDLEKILHSVEEATKASMEGKLSIHAALVARVKALNIKKQHVLAAIDYLQQQITDSFLRNFDFIKSQRADTFIFSGGFTEIIAPIVEPFHIPKHHIFANHFIYDQGHVVGIQDDCLLAHNFGKAEQFKRLNRSGSVYVIGDGATDAEIKTVGTQVKFYLFAENVFRENLKSQADKIIYDLDEFIKEEFF